MRGLHPILSAHSATSFEAVCALLESTLHRGAHMPQPKQHVQVSATPQVAACGDTGGTSSAWSDAITIILPASVRRGTSVDAQCAWQHPTERGRASYRIEHVARDRAVQMVNTDRSGMSPGEVRLTVRCHEHLQVGQ